MTFYECSADVGEVAVSVGKDVFSSLEERRGVRVAPLKGPPGEETVKGASEDAVIGSDCLKLNK